MAAPVSFANFTAAVAANQALARVLVQPLLARRVVEFYMGQLQQPIDLSDDDDEDDFLDLMLGMQAYGALFAIAQNVRWEVNTFFDPQGGPGWATSNLYRPHILHLETRFDCDLDYAGHGPQSWAANFQADYGLDMPILGSLDGSFPALTTVEVHIDFPYGDVRAFVAMSENCRVWFLRFLRRIVRELRDMFFSQPCTMSVRLTDLRVPRRVNRVYDMRGHTLSPTATRIFAANGLGTRVIVV